jgi:hypothetical protein
MEIPYFLHKLKYGFLPLFMPDRQRPGWSKTTPRDKVTYATMTTHPKETETSS